MDQKLLAGFASLFWGQANCYFNLSKMSTVWEPLTVDVFLAHLRGELELGVYCTNDQNLSYWGCIDFDAPEKTKTADLKAYQMATQARSAYAEAGIKAWIERSKSKGYHLWIFPQQPMSSRVLRSSQLSILERVGISGAIEVNPKQSHLWHISPPQTAPSWRRFGIGNLVRIPYSALAGPGRMCFMGRGYRPMGLPEWLSEALTSRPAVDALARLARPAEGHREPLGAVSRPSHGGGGHQEAWQVWQGERELYEGERDNQFHALAHLLKSQGHTRSEAERQITIVYQEKVLDKSSYSLHTALEKARRVYQ